MCAVGACNKARKYKEKYVIKPHISAFNGSLELQFWKCTDPKFYPKWTFPVTERILSLERTMLCVQTTSNTEDLPM